VTRVVRVRGPVARVEGGRVGEDVAYTNPAAGNPRDSAGPVITGATDGVAAQERPTNVRTMALCVIAVILTLFALRTADAFFIPLLLSLFLNYALAPVVARMSHLGVPRPIGAALAVTLLVAMLAGAFYRVGNDVTTVLEQLPFAVQRFRFALADTLRQHTGVLEHMKRAATELEKLADAAAR